MKVKALFTFLRNYVLFDKSELNRKFYKEIEETEKVKAMNTDDIIRMVDREETARRLLEEKLGLSLEKIAAIANVPVATVKEIKEELGVH